MIAKPSRPAIYAIWPAPLVIAHERYAAAMQRSYSLYRAYRAAERPGNEIGLVAIADQIQGAEREEDEAWEPWEELYQLWMDGQL